MTSAAVLISVRAQTGLIAAAGVVATAIPGFEPSTSAITEAQKLAKYAASSLGFEDVPTAIQQLTGALKLLTQPRDIPTTARRRH